MTLITNLEDLVASSDRVSTAATALLAALSEDTPAAAEGPTPKFSVGDFVHVKNFMWDRPEGLEIVDVRIYDGIDQISYRVVDDRVHGAFREADVFPASVPALWGYQVGDRVVYTDYGDLPGVERVVSEVRNDHLRLASPLTRNSLGAAYHYNQIKRVN